MGSNFSAVRLTTTGEVDTSFGVDGLQQTPFYDESGEQTYAYADSAFVDAEGRILLAGRAGDRAALVRYLPDGSLDTSFGSGGRAWPVTDEPRQYPSPDQGTVDAALDANGRLVMADNDYVKRFLSDGTLDPSFGGGNGVVSIDKDQEPGVVETDEVTSVAVQPDGKIVAVGAVLVRLNADGSLDPTFGRSGFADLPGQGRRDVFARGYDLAVENDGRLLITGVTLHYEAGYAGPDGDYIARLNSNGTLDPSFDGEDGLVPVQVPSLGASVTRDASGRILISGPLRSTESSPEDFAITRLLGSPPSEPPPEPPVLAPDAPSDPVPPSGPCGVKASFTFPLFEREILDISGGNKVPFDLSADAGVSATGSLASNARACFTNPTLDKVFSVVSVGGGDHVDFSLVDGAFNQQNGITRTPVDFNVKLNWPEVDDGTLEIKVFDIASKLGIKHQLTHAEASLFLETELETSISKVARWVLSVKSFSPHLRALSASQWVVQNSGRAAKVYGRAIDRDDLYKPMLGLLERAVPFAKQLGLVIKGGGKLVKMGAAQRRRDTTSSRNTFLPTETSRACSGG